MARKWVWSENRKMRNTKWVWSGNGRMGNTEWVWSGNGRMRNTEWVWLGNGEMMYNYTCRMVSEVLYTCMCIPLHVQCVMGCGMGEVYHTV